MNLMLLALTALAAYRIWRFVGEDTFAAFRVPREWLERSLGYDHWAVELVTCPWCAGAWISFAVVAALALTDFVPVPLPVLHALATSTLVGLVAQVDEA